MPRSGLDAGCDALGGDAFGGDAFGGDASSVGEVDIFHSISPTQGCVPPNLCASAGNIHGSLFELDDFFRCFNTEDFP